MYTKEQIQNTIERVEQMQPYSVLGKPETYSDYNQGWEHACSMLSAELPEQDDLQSLSIADLVGLIGYLVGRLNNTHDNSEYDEIVSNLADINTELRRRYSSLFPNNKHFTP
jgi:hypothetical protein